MKKIRMCIILLFVILLIPINSNATGEYSIESYDINIIVNEDNTMEITETIETYFNISKHGIFRKIPLRNEVVRLDGTKSNNRARITDVKVSEKFTMYNENGYKVIKIGDENKTLRGKKEYTIQYTYNIRKRYWEWI